MPLNVDLLETSFDLLAPRGEELVEIFYDRLFAEAPELRPLFARADMKRQRAMLLAALVLLRNSLRDLDALVPKLKALGARHLAYGVTEAHYAPVGAALLGALAELAGERWTPELEAAWADAYGVVRDTMLAGAAEAEAPLAA